MKFSLLSQDCSDMLLLFLLYEGPRFSEGEIGRDVIPIPVKPDIQLRGIYTTILSRELAWRKTRCFTSLK